MMTPSVSVTRVRYKMRGDRKHIENKMCSAVQKERRQAENNVRASAGPVGILGEKMDG